MGETEAVVYGALEEAEGAVEVMGVRSAVQVENGAHPRAQEGLVVQEQGLRVLPVMPTHSEQARAAGLEVVGLQEMEGPVGPVVLREAEAVRVEVPIVPRAVLGR